MKKFMFIVILALVGIIMYQGGCFKDFDFYYGSKIIRTLQGDTDEPITDAVEGYGNGRES